MRALGVYGGEMSRERITDAEVDHVLAGQVAEDPSLSSVASFMTSLRRLGEVTPAPETVDAAAAAAAAVVIGQAEQPTPRSERRLAAPPRRRLAPALALPLAFVLVATSFTGAAAAAQWSVPGDALYGFKITLEQVGIGRGGFEERFDEAAELAGRGRHEAALIHAANALADASAEETDAAEALTGLANVVSNEHGLPNGMVLEMLFWMIDNAGLIHDPDAEPGAFGKGVAEMARRIAEERGNRPEHAGPQDNPGDQGQGPPQGLPPNRP